MTAQAVVCRQNSSRVRRHEQHNFQQIAVQELAITVPRIEQLEFPQLIEDARTTALFDIKGDTAANRSTRLFDPGVEVSYRFVETTTFPKVRFCWSIPTNAAGRFLTFRERTSRRGTVTRDQFGAFLKKSAAIRESKANRDALDARREARARASGTVNEETCR